MTLILIDPAFMTIYLVMDKLPLRKIKFLQKRYSRKYDERYLVDQTPQQKLLQGLYSCVSFYGDV